MLRALLLGFRSRPLRAAIVLCGFASITWFALSCVVARHLTARATPRFAEVPPELSWTRVEPLRLSTSDGLEIGAWWCPLDESPSVAGSRAQDAKNTGPTLDDEAPAAVVLHGNGGSRSGLLGRAEELAALGCASLLVTLRAHGDSAGEYNDFGRGARGDVIAAVRWLRARRPGRRVVVIGSSLGAAAALLAAGELGSQVDGYVLECPYRDLATAACNRLAMQLPAGLDQLAYAGLRAAGALIDPGLLDLSLERRAAQSAIATPVLVFCGEYDEHATCVEAEAVARALGPNARLVVFGTAAHDGCLQQDPALWRAEIGAWLDRVRQR